MIVNRSKIDSEWMVYTVEETDGTYDTHTRLFEIFGIAYANLSSKLIVIDGKKVKEEKLTKNHLLAIEAHEIGHSISGHGDEINKETEVMEREADWAAYYILTKIGKTKAADLIAERYESLYEQKLEDYEINPSVKIKIENFK